MIRLRKTVAWWLVVLTAAAVCAQQPTPAGADLLTLDTVFTYRSQGLEAVHWQADGRGYLALEPSATKPVVPVIARYDANTGARSLLVTAEQLLPAGATAPLVIEQFDLNADGQKLLLFTNSERVWRSNTRGDYWLLDLKGGEQKTGKLTKLGGKEAQPSTLMFAKFSPEGGRVGYVRGNNIYVENLVDGVITPITTNGTFHLVNGTFDWVYEEELFCRDGWRWSPDGEHIAYWQLDSEGVKEFQLVNNTAGLYPAITSFPYPKAGETNSAARVGVVSAHGGTTQWFDIAGDPRNNYLPRMEWAANSSEVAIQQLNRLQNTDIVMLGDISTGKVRPILTEKDDAWVDVGFGELDWDKQGIARGDLEWVEGGKRFLWASERDGWRHIYSISRDGSDVRRITSGEYDVIGVEKVDAAGGWLYYDGSPANATQKYLFRTRLDGSDLTERLSPLLELGTHRYDFAPQGDLAIHTFATFAKPPVTDVVRLPKHEKVRTLIDNHELAERLGKLKPTPSEFFRVDIGNDLELDGWMIKPPDFDARKRYPVLFYVYGEPAAQTVLDDWGGGTQMWHKLLAQQGYIVVSVDNRGTPAPRGRAWRKIIYRKAGIISSQDQASAVRAIDKWPFVDARRIAMWGWSGGGSSSLNAIFRYPDIYSTAMAVAPVADLRLYDTIYQERYCALPQEHPNEYQQSSPVTFARQLQGHLLVVHGTGDDNVHYQGTEELVNALIAANKTFTIMPYPGRSHGIYEGPGTRRHLFGLLTRYLNENVPPGPRGE